MNSVIVGHEWKTTGPRARPGQVDPIGARSGPSISGWYLLLLGLTVFGSAFSGSRIAVGGWLVHPYLLALAPATFIVCFNRLGDFPTRTFWAFVLFGGLFTLASLSPLPDLGEIVKLGSSIVTIISVAVLVRRRGDFVAGVVGLSLAAALMGLRGLQSGDVNEGINPIDVANKNSYSLYALPPILLAGYVLVQPLFRSPTAKLVLFVASMISSVTIVASGNRSGWLGLALILLLLLKRSRMRSWLIVAMLVGGVYFWTTNYTDSTVRLRKVEDSQSGKTADRLRMQLFQACFEISLENPLIGVSPKQLFYELPRYIEPDESKRAHYIDPHNVFGYVLAGTGWICFLSLMYVGYTMVNWKDEGQSYPVKANPLWSGVVQLRGVLWLWCLRGMFSREVLYAPSFSIGIGLSIGLCLVEQRIAQQRGSSPIINAPPLELGRAN